MDLNTVAIKPQVIAKTLAKIALFLIAACIFTQIIRFITGHGRLLNIVPLFSLDGENNFPSYFSMLLILLASSLLTIIGILEKRRASVYFKHWLILGIVFLLMSMDEITSLHETLVLPVRRLLGINGPSIFYWSWVIPGIIFVFCLGLLFLKFVFHLQQPIRKIFIFSGVVYLAGVIAMELVGGYYASLYGTYTVGYVVCTVIEESLEMFGMIAFIFGLLKYIENNFTQINFKTEENSLN